MSLYDERDILDKYHFMTCEVCGFYHGSTPHHVQSVKSGGTNDEWNIIPLCLRCHGEIHTIGRSTFAKKYPQFRSWLIKNGWEYDKFFNKWFHRKSSDGNI